MIRAAHILIGVLAVIAPFQLSGGQNIHWENFTSKSEITSLEYYSGYLWVSTLGGFVRVDPHALQVKAYINSDGVGSVKLNFSTFAGDGIAYLGSADGMITRMDIPAEDFYNIQLTDRDGTQIELHNADTSDGFLWIATDIGVIKFDRFRHGGEVKETYRTLGSFETESKVFDVLISDSLIYAATAAGIAYGRIDNPYLVDPREWGNVGSGEAGLSADSVFILQIFHDVVFAGTEEGLFRMAETDTLTAVAELQGHWILDLCSTADTLYVVSVKDAVRRLFAIDDQGVTQVSTPGVPAGELNAVTQAERLFLGTRGRGLFLKQDDLYEELELPGPASSNLVGGGFAADGSLYAAGRFTDLSKYDNGLWERIPVTTAQTFVAELDLAGSLWIGTFGDGVYQLRPTGELLHFNKYNSPLRGNDDDTSYNYITINDIYVDRFDQVWFATYRGFPTRPLVMFRPQDSLWTYFDAEDGIVSDRSRTVAAGVDMVAVGFEDRGVTVITFGASPFDHSDDQIRNYDRGRGLPSTTINALAFDLGDTLWVGTNQGLAFFDSGLELFISVPLPAGVSSDVRALAVDSRNNLWVGTADGLAFIADQQSRKEAFSTHNSDLVSDEVQNLNYDQVSGRVSVFTTGGLSILDYGPAQPDSASGVRAYPNPFILQSGSDLRLLFSYQTRAEIRIYNVAGELVRVTDVNTGWDGKNDAGQLVASGVYLYDLHDAENSRRFSGKILVVRE